MPSTSELESPTGAGADSRTGTIDCDFWGYRPTIHDIAPHLPASWQHYYRLNQAASQSNVVPALIESPYFVAGTAVSAPRDVDDAVERTRTHLDERGIACAVLNPGTASAASALSNPIFTADVARATNEWTVARWLDVDDRLRGSIVVSGREPARAAAEIRRAADDPRLVQVLIAYPPQLLGHRALAPIHAAAAEVGLPLCLQAGGDFSGGNQGVTALGAPGGTRFEGIVAWEFGGQPHLVNLLVSGTFDRFPGLRVVLSGFGVAWLPSLLWRLDMEVRSGQIELPRSLTRLPSEILAERVRFTTSTIELPADPAHLVALLESIGAEDLLLYGTGPRRADHDADIVALAPAAWRRRLAGDNARAFLTRLPPAQSVV